MTKPGQTAFVALRGIVVALLFISLWVWLASLVRRLDPALGVTPPRWLHPAGWLLAVAGGLLGLSCVAVFITRGRGTPAPFDAPQVFVPSGPYRYTRNPMYIGAVSVLLGAGFIVGSSAIVLLSLGFWLLSHIVVVLYEEPNLERRFGETYTQYRRHVRRWIPGPPRRL